MAGKLIVFVCAQALLAQCALSQINLLRPSSIAGINGNSIVENTVVVGNNAGIGGYGLTNSGLIGSSVGLANTGLSASGLGLANTGILGTGLGLANTVLPTANIDYLSLNSVSGGGVLPINSFSPIAPAGLTVVSDNAIQGPITVVGQLPFLSAVAFEGALASEGSGAAGCGCGSNGNVGIISESYAPIAAPAISGLGVGAGLGLGAGLGRSGLYF